MEVHPAVLSDDEVVALAADVGSPWAGPLVTLDRADGAEMMAAVDRGVRALTRRGLFDVGEGRRGPDATLELLARAACGHPSVVAFVADPAVPSELAGLCALVFPFEGSRVLVEITAGLGRHELAVADPGQAAEWFVTMVRDVFEDAEVRQAARALYVTRSVEPGADLVEVRPGRFTTGRFRDDLTVEALASGVAVDVEAVRQFFGAA